MKALLFLTLGTALLFALSPYEVSEKIKRMTFEEYKAYIKTDEYQHSMHREVEHPDQPSNKVAHSKSGRSGNCEKFVVLHSAERLAREVGETSQWINSADIMIHLWTKPSSLGKGNIIGDVRPGSHARILEETTDDYKVLSPLDQSVGWVTKQKVSRTQFEDSETREECTR